MDDSLRQRSGTLTYRYDSVAGIALLGRIGESGPQTHRLSAVSPERNATWTYTVLADADKGDSSSGTVVTATPPFEPAVMYFAVPFTRKVVDVAHTLTPSSSGSRPCCFHGFFFFSSRVTTVSSSQAECLEPLTFPLSDDLVCLRRQCATQFVRGGVLRKRSPTFDGLRGCHSQQFSCRKFHFGVLLQALGARFQKSSPQLQVSVLDDSGRSPQSSARSGVSQGSEGR